MHDLTPEQARAHAEFQAFVDREIAPFADEHHRAESMPREAVRRLAERGYLAGRLAALDR